MLSNSACNIVKHYTIGGIYSTVVKYSLVCITAPVHTRKGTFFHPNFDAK